MRMTFAIALPLLFVAALVLPADAQQIKQVTVTNLPAVQDVFVTNPSAPAPPARFQLVGFTTNQNYDGDLGGWFGATDKCQMDFAAARICTFDEVRNTTTIPALPAGTNAWAGDTCMNWTVGLRGSGSTLAVVNSDTGIQGTEFCDIPHPVACCKLVP